MCGVNCYMYLNALEKFVKNITFYIHTLLGGNEHRHTFYNGFSPAARDPKVDE